MDQATNDNQNQLHIKPVDRLKKFIVNRITDDGQNLLRINCKGCSYIWISPYLVIQLVKGLHYMSYEFYLNYDLFEIVKYHPPNGKCSWRFFRWFPNGMKRSERYTRHGVAQWYREWNKNGDLIEDYKY